MKRLTWLLFFVFMCSFAYSDTIIHGEGELVIRLSGEKGEKGEQGEPGPPGPQGPPGQGGVDAGIWVNVKEHGVVGNGRADDTEAIQKLLRELPKTSTLKFPMGIYKLSDTLVNSRNHNIVGSGSGSRIYQSGDKPLLVVNAPGTMTIENMWFASAATSEGAALILLEPDSQKRTPAPSHIKIRDIYVSGGDMAVSMRGVLFPRLDNIQQSTPWNATSYPTTIGRAGIYAEYAGRAANAITIINPTFQGGYKRAIWVKAGKETGLTVIGGCLEAMKEAAIVCDGVCHYVNITGTHFEGTEGTVQLNGCQQVNISGVLGIGRYGIILKGCRRFGIRDVYGWSIDADESNWNGVMENVLYKTLKLGARMVEARNFNCIDNQSLGPSGTYTSDLPDNIDENTNGSLEQWSAGKPVGFTVYGAVEQEQGIVYEGRSAARVKWAQIGGLRFDVPMKYVRQGGVITVYMMCYKPDNGFNPRFAAIYNNWNAVTVFPPIALKSKEWVVARATFNVPPGMENMFVIAPSYYAPGQQGQELIVDWIHIAASH